MGTASLIINVTHQNGIFFIHQRWTCLNTHSQPKSVIYITVQCALHRFKKMYKDTHLSSWCRTEYLHWPKETSPFLIHPSRPGTDRQWSLSCLHSVAFFGASELEWHSMSLSRLAPLSLSNMRLVSFHGLIAHLLSAVNNGPLLGCSTVYRLTWRTSCLLPTFGNYE